MHELSLTQHIVEVCNQQAMGAQARGVRRVRVEVGALAAVVPDALRFCFDVCAQGTLLEGAVLEIVEVAGVAVCQDCGADVALDEPYGLCDCGSTRLRIVAGEQLLIKDMEVL